MLFLKGTRATRDRIGIRQIGCRHPPWPAGGARSAPTRRRAGVTGAAAGRPGPTDRTPAGRCTAFCLPRSLATAQPRGHRSAVVGRRINKRVTNNPSVSRSQTLVRNGARKRRRSQSKPCPSLLFAVFSLQVSRHHGIKHVRFECISISQSPSHAALSFASFRFCLCFRRGPPDPVGGRLQALPLVRRRDLQAAGSDPDPGRRGGPDSDSDFPPESPAEAVLVQDRGRRPQPQGRPDLAQDDPGPDGEGQGQDDAQA